MENWSLTSSYSKILHNWSLVSSQALSRLNPVTATFISLQVPTSPSHKPCKLPLSIYTQFNPFQSSCARRQMQALVFLLLTLAHLFLILLTLHSTSKVHLTHPLKEPRGRTHFHCCCDWCIGRQHHKKQVLGSTLEIQPSHVTYASLLPPSSRTSLYLTWPFEAGTQDLTPTVSRGFPHCLMWCNR